MLTVVQVCDSLRGAVDEPLEAVVDLAEVSKDQRLNLTELGDEERLPSARRVGRVVGAPV